jgi:hypothetical protein
VRRFLALLAVVVAAVAAAAFTVPSTAATVNGSAIHRSDLDSDLSSIAASPDFQCYLKADFALGHESTTGLFPLHGANSATTSAGAVYNANFVRYWLGTMVRNKLLSQVVTRTGHRSVTANATTVARATLTREIGSALSEVASTPSVGCATTSAAVVLGTLPKSFVNSLVSAQADQLLLSLPKGYGLDTASLHRYFGGHPASFTGICLSAVIFPTQSAAVQAAKDVTTTGKPFSGTGQEEVLGCAPRYAATSFPTSVTSLPVGKVSAPLATPESGEYALLEVTKTEPPTFSKVAVAEAMATSGSARAGAEAERAYRRSRVTVDPRYGKVAPLTVAIQPASSPPSSSVLDPLADTPASAPEVASSAVTTPGTTGTPLGTG